MINPNSKSYLRTHHALRCAVGAGVVGAIGLSFPVFNVCISHILFFVGTIAGTPQNYQGFQLRSISLTFTGAILGSIGYAIIVVIANSVRIGIFFATLPFICFFSALRPDTALAPLPAIANVVLGLLLISHVQDGRTLLRENMINFLIAAVIAWATAIAVNIVLPCRAADVGRQLIADELRRIGSVISNVVATAFLQPSKPPSNGCAHNVAGHSAQSSSTVPFRPPGSAHFAVTLPENADSTEPVLLPFKSRDSSQYIGMNEDMIRSAYDSLRYLRTLPPFGSTRLSDYSTLSEARDLLESSAYEPRLLPESTSHWRNVSAWQDVVDAVIALVHKVSCLESVILLYCGGQGKVYSRVSSFLGEAYIPLWVYHFASCASSCAQMSRIMCQAKCVQLLPSGIDSRKQGDTDFRRWRSLRVEMYFGFLLHYRLSTRNDSVILNRLQRSEMRNLEPPTVQPLDLQYNISHTVRRQVGPLKCLRSKDLCQSELQILDQADRRAMSFFSIASQALFEEIGHVRKAMVDLQTSSDARGWLAPFQFLIGVFPSLKQRVMALQLAQVHAWEVQFIFTHFLLLTCLLALALFIPTDIFKQRETAWAFASAALAAQISAEPTLFIGILRVIATVAGSVLGFGFSYFLRVLDTDIHVRYFIIPYMAVVIIFFLLVIPPSYRYAAFLIIVTNAVMVYCPRVTDNCRDAGSLEEDSCLANLSYGISRTISVTAGVVFAIIFHIVFWPRYANDEAIRKLGQAYTNAVRMLQRLRLNYFSFGLEGKNRIAGTSNVPTQHDLASSVEHSNEKLSAPKFIYRTDQTLVQDVRQRVGKYVSKGVQTVQSEASVFNKGPLGMRPLLPRLIPDFIALDVTLSEMAVLLGRHPIFSASYGRNLYEEIIEPMMSQYETIHISLNNLASTVNTAAAPRRRARISPEIVMELCQAIRHLARCRSVLREMTHTRRYNSNRSCKIDLDIRARLKKLLGGDREGGTEGEWLSNYSGKMLATTDDIDDVRLQQQQLNLDDVIMYDSFTFVAEGCLSAFLRIALTVLECAKAELESDICNQNKRKYLWAAKLSRLWTRLFSRKKISAA